MLGPILQILVTNNLEVYQGWRKKKKDQPIHGLTCSSIKSSSNTRPAVSTGSTTLPSALRVFKIASDIETKQFN